MLSKETISTSLKLLIITAIAALCLALVNKLTAPVIAQNQIKTMEAAQKEVLPEADSFKALDFSNEKLEFTKTSGTYIDNFYLGMNGDKTVGYVVTAVSKKGYGGDIRVMVGIKSDLTINKVKITETKETAGLGLNASKPDFIEQYIGRSEYLSVIKNSDPTTEGTDIAAISSATVTSKAVTNAVNTAIELVNFEASSNNQDDINKVEAIKEEISKETEKQLKEGE